ncbi:MAG: cadherin-like domain-containing protein [Desulfuromonadales bacterium]|nr:cadherin-like domain-containing protein [Desulfuromonadales bacterium]
MKSKSFVSLFTLMFVLLMSSVASAAPTLVSPSPNSFGEIERITLNDPANVYSGGVLVVGGVEMILPKNLLIDLPANRLSLQQIFDQAPAACKAQNPPESGLAKVDKCNATGSGGIATLSAVRTNAGNVIVGDLFIQKAAETVHGVVTYINYDQGYYRVNGSATNPANTGAMVRLNDPGLRHTIQSGAGCAGGPNCSPDPRFCLDPDNYTNTFTTGYPMCIPSTVSRPFPGLTGVPAGTAVAAADGTGDLLCPDTNRTAALVEPAVADSRRFAPVKLGDTALAEGNFETVGGVRFLSAHSSSVQKALSTRTAADQPDYLFLEEVGVEAPPYQNQRLITLLIGFTTLANPATDVDLWTLHRDPVTNETHEFPFASVQGCDNAGGAGTCSNQGLVGAGANIFKIRHDVDFLIGPQPKLSPCAHLLASRFATSHPGICSGAPTTARDIAVLSPVPHEIIARTGRKITSPAGSLITIDINGNPATNGEYLFPLGLNLGGLGVAEMSEVNINELFTPIPFEGITWNLDRRLGPSGCLNNGGVCEAGAVGSAAFALDPFPYSGLDPRLQTSLLPNVSYIDPVFSPTTLTSSRNRMFSYVLGTNFNGNATVMPYALGTFPADPPLIQINPTPALNIFPPVVVADSATTPTGTAVVINVLANDVAVLGTLDPLSVTIVTPPASGTAVVNLPAGTITYTPTTPFSVGTATFTYTVANNFGSVSSPATVTVTITRKPTAVNDTAIVPAKSSSTISLVANDIAGTSPLNLASVVIVSALPANGSCGTLLNNLDGNVLYTAPQTVPAAPGTCSFSYTISDVSLPALISNVATVTVTITAPVAPTAVNDTATTTTGLAVIIPVLTNDTSPLSAINPATVSVSTPTGAIAPNTNSGTVSANLNGTVTYTAPPTAGTYVFSYTVKNSAVTPSISNTATVTITVTQGHIAPTAVNDTFPNATVPALITAGSPVTLNVLTNDTATTGSLINPASVAVSVPAGNGSATVDAITGIVTYTPPATAGTYTFTYTVKDNFSTPATSNVATVTVTVTVTASAPPAATTIFNPTGNISTITPSFSFVAVPGATGYQLFLQNNTTGTGAPTAVFTPVQAGCASGTGLCSITLPSSLLNNNAYSWQASALNAAGQGPWSNGLNFFVGALVPPAPTIISPTGTVITTTPAFTFNAVPGATGYQLFLQNNTTVTGHTSIVFTPEQAGCPLNGGNGICSLNINFATPLVSTNSYSWNLSVLNAAGQGPFSTGLNFIVQ